LLVAALISTVTLAEGRHSLTSEGPGVQATHRNGSVCRFDHKQCLFRRLQ
jgi:hypothetical protein